MLAPQYPDDEKMVTIWLCCCTCAQRTAPPRASAPHWTRAHTHAHTHAAAGKKTRGGGERERKKSFVRTKDPPPGEPPAVRDPCAQRRGRVLGAGRRVPSGGRAPQPPPSRTNWTRPVPRPVLTGHVPPMPRRFYLYQGGRHTWKPVLRTSWARTRCESPYVRRNRSSASAAAGARGELWAQRPTGA